MANINLFTFGADKTSQSCQGFRFHRVARFVREDVTKMPIRKMEGRNFSGRHERHDDDAETFEAFGAGDTLDFERRHIDQFGGNPEND